MSRRQILYSRGLFNCLVHLIWGDEDNYFTRYKAALVCGYGESGSRNVIWSVKNYEEVRVAEREVDCFQFPSNAFNHFCDVGAAA